MEDDKPLYHLRLVGQLHGSMTQTGWWFTTASTHTNPDHRDNCNKIVDRFAFRVMPKITLWGNQQWQLFGLICATMYPRHGPIIERPFEVGGGFQIGECLPAFNSGVLSLRTGIGGRSHLGRTYYPAISEGDSVSSQLTADARTRLQDIGNAILDGFSTASTDNEFHYGVYSHKLGDVPLPAPAVGKAITPAGFTPIVQTIARRYIFTMRKRLPGRGP